MGFQYEVKFDEKSNAFKIDSCGLSFLVDASPQNDDINRDKHIGDVRCLDSGSSTAPSLDGSLGEILAIARVLYTVYAREIENGRGAGVPLGERVAGIIGGGKKFIPLSTIVTIFDRRTTATGSTSKLLVRDGCFEKDMPRNPSADDIHLMLRGVGFMYPGGVRYSPDGLVRYCPEIDLVHNHPVANPSDNQTLLALVGRKYEPFLEGLTVFLDFGDCPRDVEPCSVVPYLLLPNITGIGDAIRINIGYHPSDFRARGKTFFPASLKD